MKLCVFQGTFDPIHNAHIKMAEFTMNNYGFDKVLFIPAFDPPHKNSVTAPAKDRFEMVKLAVMDNPCFEVSDIEFKRGGKSYTYLTICELYEKYSIDGKISFIIGTDAFEKIDSWYEAEKLKKLVKFIVFKRTDQNILYKVKADFEISEMNFEDISSTSIREQIKSGIDIKKHVNKKVEEYIKQHELYRN